MESITKAVFTNKLNSVTDSVTKNLNFSNDEEKEQSSGLSSKERRKLEEDERIAKAKRDEMHAKREEERRKKREAIRAKYGIEKNEKEGQRRPSSQPKVEQTSTSEEKSCSVM